MKKKLFVIILLTVSTAMFAQSRFSAGLIGSRFENLGSGSRMSQMAHPYGFGVIGAYNINNDLTTALTLEYFRGNIDGIDGKENDYRAHLSAYYHPVTFYGLRPYISGGLVYSYKKYDLNSIVPFDESKSNLYGRFGFGIDYKIISGISANIDFGFYNDGSKIAGWSNSIGIRYQF